jgi:hypothetical protein
MYGEREREREREREEVHTGFWWGNLRERKHLEDIGVDGKAILKCIIIKSNWIDLAHDRDQ